MWNANIAMLSFGHRTRKTTIVLNVYVRPVALAIHSEQNVFWTSVMVVINGFQKSQQNIEMLVGDPHASYVTNQRRI